MQLIVHHPTASDVIWDCVCDVPFTAMALLNVLMAVMNLQTVVVSYFHFDVKFLQYRVGQKSKPQTLIHIFIIY